ncbi:uncharacterized protein BO66DRAFT_14142 [Aspergillus aculeatinus CBS 121060]|uniref:Uncharacterized protein n=1 Tax=Aspergillus aculeatinus CBS 121060 TaxID=1448322 RepID=A0ACD1HQB6_9EURO|nr:hypothetical protein BO66DRAFT_14142 [Aspergillus aculeatinus CBS 121060]RAH75687.1 hypothetical protein BO66DRAFT_14142 [Aspergillus aculeatinus CBS 121060]
MPQSGILSRWSMQRQCTPWPSWGICWPLEAWSQGDIFLTQNEGGLVKLLDVSVQLLRIVPDGTHNHEIELIGTAYTLMAFHINTWHLSHLEKSLSIPSPARITRRISLQSYSVK